MVVNAKKQAAVATQPRLPPGPKGHPILGVMREFNRDTLAFITRCRDYGDVVRMRFLYVTAYFLFHPDDIEYVLSTNPKNFFKAMSLRSNFFHRLVADCLRAKAKYGNASGAWPNLRFTGNALIAMRK